MLPGSSKVGDVMIVLVGYVTIEGQSRKIAEAVAAAVERTGNRAVLFNVMSMAEYALERPEAAILCAPIHGGRYPAPFAAFVTRERDFLNSVPSAFISASLFIASEYEEEQEKPGTSQISCWPRAAGHRAMSITPPVRCATPSMISSNAGW